MPRPTRHKHGRFRATGSTEWLYRMIREVAARICADRPLALTQSRFDAHAPRIAAELGEPEPPSARAIYMRINKGKPRNERKSWEQIVAEACGADRSAVQTLAAATRSEVYAFLDEYAIVYALRRISIYLGARSFTAYAYDAARAALIAARARKPGGTIALVLPTSGQILAAAQQNWNLALQLAGLDPVSQPEREDAQRRALRMIEFFYESENHLPRYNELIRYFRARDVSVPEKELRPFPPLIAATIAARAERGLDTQPDGPLPEQRLLDAERDALIADLPRATPRDYWTRDRIIDAFADYVEGYEGTAELRQRHYQSVRAEHGWPAINRLAQHGLGFPDAVAEGRRRLVRRAAA
jgi:hypothetical protein